MRRNFILLFALACTINTGFSQTIADKKKITLHSINSAALLNGSLGSSLSLQTILGIAYGRSFGGIGVGLDYYRFRSIPLFIDLRQEFGKGNRNVFLYGDLGYNFDWLTEKNKQNSGYFSTFNYGGGIYYDVGIGYKIGFKNANALLISTGYSFKKLKNETGTGICPFFGPCYDEHEMYTYSLGRLILKMGWRF